MDDFDDILDIGGPDPAPAPPVSAKPEQGALPVSTGGSLLPWKDAADWLRNNFDEEWYDVLYRDQRYVIDGMEYRETSDAFRSFEYNDGLPVYYDLRPTYARVGQSKRLLSESYWAASALVSSIPIPESPDTDIMTSAIRSAFYHCRWQGIGTPGGEWQEALQRSLVSSYLFGIAGVMVGVQRNQRNGKRFTVTKDIAPQNIIWDRFASHPQNSTAVGVVHYMSVDDAIARYGHAQQVEDAKIPVLRGLQILHMVRVMEYYDIGARGKEPTHHIWVGTVNEKPIYSGPSLVGERGHLPLAFITHFSMANMSVPIGRVRMGAATAALKQALDTRWLNILENGQSLDLLDSGMAPVARLQTAIDNGNRFVDVTKISEKDRQLFLRIPEQEIPQSLIAMRQIVDSEENENSNTTDLDRGSPISAAQSATEVALIAEKAEKKNALMRRELLNLYRRHAEITFATAAALDTHPARLEIDALGNTYTATYNDDDVPGSEIANIFEEESRVIIDEASLTSADEQRKKDFRMAQIERGINLGLVGVSPGQIRLSWASEEFLRVLGQQNPEDIMVPDQQQMPGMAMPGAENLPPDQAQALALAGQMGMPGMAPGVA